MQFEASMSQVAAISGATGRELELLTETAKYYGETTMFSASQAAEALNYMALAGWDAQQSVDALGGVLDLAAASGMDLGAASDAVTDYLSAFSMEASQAGYMADLMAYAQSKSNTTASMLADAYGNCATSMHAAGQDIETTTAMLMALANQGIKGSEAGTQMAAVMRDLTQKMDDGQIMIGKTAVKVTDAAGNFRDLNDILADVGKATAGMGTAEQSAALMTTFTARSVKAIQTLLNEGMDSVNAYEDALRGSAGAAAQQAEIMMDNLQGDIKIFQSALEGVQITASESTNGAARSLVQEATGILEAVNKAGKAGGIAGMADALIGQIPSLLPKLTKGVEGLLGGLGKRLPGLVKNLIATIPDLLTSTADLIPSLTDSITQALGGAVEGVISNWPSIAAALAKGVGNLLLGSFKGLDNLLSGLGSGITGALKSSGLIKKDLNDLLADAVSNIDTSSIRLKDIALNDISLDGDIDTSAYTEKIAAAKTELETAIDGLKLSDADAAALKRALLKGSGADALKAALQALNIPDEDITSITTSISSFRDKLNGVLAEFHVDDPDGAITANIADYVAQGNSLQEALALFAGLSAEDAKTAADNLQPDLDAAVAAINALNIDGLDTSTIYNACFDANGEIETALKLLGMNDETIKAAMASVETLGSSISTQIGAVFDEIKEAFTNGKASDDAEAAEKALGEIGDAAEEGHAQIDTWLSNFESQLAQMNLSASDYQAAVTDAEAKAAAMHDELDSTISAAQQWVSENAGAVTKEVEGHLSELDGILSSVESLEARIASLKSALTPEDYTYRTAVANGFTGDKSMQANAIQLTSKERAQAVEQANLEYAQAMEKAGKEYEKFNDAYLDMLNNGDKKVKEYMAEDSSLSEKDAWDKFNAELSNAEAAVIQAGDALKTASDELEAKRQESIAAADQTYNDWMDLIFSGMLKSSDALTGGVQESIDALRNADLANRVMNAMTGGEATSVDQLKQALGVTPEMWSNLAEALGSDAERFDSLLAQAFESGAATGKSPWEIFMNTLGGGVRDLAGSYDSLLQGVLEGLTGEGGPMAEFASVIASGLENNLFEGLEGVELTGDRDADIQSILDHMLRDYVNAAVESAGNEPEVPVGFSAVAEPEAVEVPEDTGEKIAGAVEEAAEGGDAEASPTLTVDPEVKPADGTAEAITQAAEQAVEGTEEAAAQTVNAEVDLGLTIGAVTVDGGSDVAGAIAAQLSGQKADVAVDINAKVGNVSFDGGGAVNTAARQLVSNAVSAAQGQTSSAASVGRNFTSGLASGILSGRSAVISAAISVANAAAAAARAALQIHSPSRVTEGFGRMFDQGFAVGIDKEAGSVVRSAVNLANNVVGAVNLPPKMDLSGLAASMSGAISDLADIENGRDVALYLNGREMARASTKDYNTALNGYAKRIGLGYGRW